MDPGNSLQAYTSWIGIQTYGMWAPKFLLLITNLSPLNIEIMLSKTGIIKIPYFPEISIWNWEYGKNVFFYVDINRLSLLFGIIYAYMT